MLSSWSLLSGRALPFNLAVGCICGARMTHLQLPINVARRVCVGHVKAVPAPAHVRTSPR